MYRSMPHLAFWKIWSHFIADFVSVVQIHISEQLTPVTFSQTSVKTCKCPFFEQTDLMGSCFKSCFHREPFHYFSVQDSHKWSLKLDSQTTVSPSRDVSCGRSWITSLENVATVPGASGPRLHWKWIWAYVINSNYAWESADMMRILRWALVLLSDLHCVRI